MMEYLRKYLISLRRSDNEGLFWNLPYALLGATLIGVAIGVILDIFLPANYFVNMLKGVLAIVTGIAMFSSSYLLLFKRTERIRENDNYYKTIRERFSYKQRVNISIVVGTVLAVFILLGNESSPFFVFKSIVAVSVTLSLLAFSRRLRSEFIKDIHEIPDLRDLETAAKRKAAEEKKKSKKKPKRK